MHNIVDDHALHGLVNLKSATEPDDEVRLRREAAVLHAAGIPGLVELIDHHDDGAVVELRTRHVGTRSALTLGGGSPATLAALGAGVATTLADLHRRGLSHGAVQADHVLIGAQGQPVLCSLGRAGADPSVWAGHLPAGDDDAPFAPAEDVAALGALLADLASRGSGWRTALGRRRLLSAAAAATAADASLRPTAAQLAVTLAGLSRGRATLVPAPDGGEAPVDPLDPPTRSFGPGPGSDVGTTGGRGRGRRIGVLVATTVVAGATTAAAIVGFSASSGPRAAAAPSATAVATPADGAATTIEPAADVTVAPADPAAEPAADTSATSPDAPTPTSCPDSYESAARDGVGVGCADLISLAGRRVSLGGLSWDVGQDGDELAVADIDCDGRLEVALLRPSTAELFAFATWAPPGQPVTVTAHAVPGALALVTDPAACGLSVRQPDGLPLAVDLADLG